MTVVRFDYCSAEPIHDPAGAGEGFDRDTGLFLPHGGSGITLWYGQAADPAGTHSVEQVAELRVDIDSQQGRAALRWLPDGSHAIEFEPIGPIEVWESHDTAQVTIPADLARVSAGTARAAVLEYVATNRRPTNAVWVAAGQPGQ